METLAFLLLVSMQRNNTGVVSISMGIFDYGYLVTTTFSQTRHNIIEPFWYIEEHTTTIFRVDE
jgi:hypothetical protein